jgi:hypothetical protein
LGQKDAVLPALSRCGGDNLDAAEFESMMKSSPMGGQTPGGLSAVDAFKKIDGDGNGQLSPAEMEDAHRQMMERFQSKVPAFGPGSGPGSEASATQSQSQDTWATLLQSIGNDDEQSKSGRAASKTDDLATQLRSLIDKLGSTYGSTGGGQSTGLSFSA